MSARAAMRRLGGAAILAFLAAGASSGAPPPRITAVEAVAVPAKHATEYQVAPVGSQPGPIDFAWTLRLVRVDTGSRAAVDPGCTNAQLGGGTKEGGLVFTWTNVGDTFLWYHGDCDHRDVGPSGHQGTVTVVVTGRGWQCTGSFAGTDAPVGPPPTCGKPSASSPTKGAPLTPPPGASSSSGGGLSIWIPIVGVLTLVVVAAAWWLLSRPRALLPAAAPTAEVTPVVEAAEPIEGALEAQARDSLPEGWTFGEHNGSNWTATSPDRQVGVFHSTRAGYRWLNATTGEYLT